MQDEAHNVDMNDGGDDEDEDGRGDEGGGKGEPGEEKTRGHRREYNEAKKVSDDSPDSLPCG